MIDALLRSTLLRLLCPILATLSLANSTQAQDPTDVVVHLNNGLILDAKIYLANDNGIMWSSKDVKTPQLMAHNQIARVDFPEPDLWKQGNTFFYKGEYTKAIAAFSSLVRNSRINFYPTPGNYASRARLRLIDCYRETGNAVAILDNAAKLDTKTLPKADRIQMEVIAAWAQLSEENLEQALANLDAISEDPIAPGRSDLGFIKGVVFEKAGKKEEAIIAYGNAYTVDFGGSRELAKRAMQNAIQLLIELDRENRDGELHSLVHTYATVYNKGKLWDGAPARAVELLGKKLELQLPEEKPESNAGKLTDHPEVKPFVMEGAAVLVDKASSVDGFKKLPLPEKTGSRLKANQTTKNDPLKSLSDGKLAETIGPVFANGIQNGAYKLDLGSAKSVTAITSWSHNFGDVRGVQKMTIYASDAEDDPGWDLKKYTPLGTIDTGSSDATFTAASLHALDDKDLGSFRWIVWAVSPVGSTGEGENTAFQELAVETKSD